MTPKSFYVSIVKRILRKYMFFERLVSGIGASGGGGAVSVSAPAAAAASGGAAAAEVKKVSFCIFECSLLAIVCQTECGVQQAVMHTLVIADYTCLNVKCVWTFQEEPQEASDDDMGFSLFD